jgi:peptide/nickel transport system permease protein
MSEKKDNLHEVNSPAENGANPAEEQHYSLSDDRRVKVLSPGMLVYKRFIRNRTAVTGLVILIFMFVFSFIGGLISPYGQNQFFYRDDSLSKEFAAVAENTEFRYLSNDNQLFGSSAQAQAMLAIQRGDTSFSYQSTDYAMTSEGTDFYSISTGGQMVGIAYKDVISPSDSATKLSFDFYYNALKAFTAGESSFTADGQTYTLDSEGGVMLGDNEIAYISRYVVQAVMPDVFLSRDFKEKLVSAIQSGETKFTYTDESLILDDDAATPDVSDEPGNEGVISTEDEQAPIDQEPQSATAEYTIQRAQNHNNWSIRQQQTSRQYDTYSEPSSSHWLGTDKYGMDMLTRLMYGGRVSLMIGFIVVIIETLLGVLFGGVAGYFGGWVDNLIMRIVDVFYCIPSMPIIIILGAAMDQQRVDPNLRMVYLMLILGFLGWPGIARLVRGQILSLREQEFMTAAEACGIRVSHRIFKHLIPNVIPQLIVNCTMGLGSVIITEATLSFLGLGVKFPFASWGNIINDVNNTFVLTSYWFIWIPAGVLLLLTVLAFNLVGDGLRDAFDPKMKR